MGMSTPQVQAFEALEAFGRPLFGRSRSFRLPIRGLERPRRR